MNDLSYRGFALDAETALALLQWQAEMGADEACLDDPIDRCEEAIAEAANRAAEQAARAQMLAEAQKANKANIGAAGGFPGATSTAPRPAAVPSGPDYTEIAARAAHGAQSLADLSEALQAFDGMDLKKGARNFCFADGNRKARVMVIGEAPGHEEDLAGTPFVGRAGQLLDQMFAAIGLTRSAPDAEKSIYITNVLPWHPTGNRTPQPEEIAMMRPFLERHVELVDPDFIVLMGNTPSQAALDQGDGAVPGIMRLRGQWQTAFGKPALPMTHPAYLLRTPLAKREAWADLLSLQARMAAKAGA